MNNPARLPLRACAALLLAACGSAETDAAPEAGAVAAAPAASAAPDPCTLLTEADAKAVLGEPLQQGRPDAGSAPSCQYVTPGGEALTLQMLPGSVRDFESYMQQSVDAFRVKAEPAPGLGDRAVWLGPMLLILRPPHMLSLTIGQNLSDEARRSLGKRLGTAALGRL